MSTGYVASKVTLIFNKAGACGSFWSVFCKVNQSLHTQLALPRDHIWHFLGHQVQATSLSVLPGTLVSELRVPELWRTRVGAWVQNAEILPYSSFRGF